MTGVQTCALPISRRAVSDQVDGSIRIPRNESAEGGEQRVQDVVTKILEELPDRQADEEPLSPAHQRLRNELANGRWAWRSIHALSGKAGIDEANALEILQADPQILLGRSKSGRMIAKLKSSGIDLPRSFLAV